MIDQRLEQIKKYTPEILFDEVAHEFVVSFVDDLIANIQVGEAKELFIFLTSILAKVPKTIETAAWRDRYETLISKIRWVAFPFLSETEVEKLFSTQIVEAIKNEYDIQGKIYGYFRISLGDEVAISSKRRLIIESLKNNNENIGNKEIIISGIEGKFPSTLKNWIRDFEQSSVIEKRVKRIAILEYLNLSVNLKGLSESNKEILRQVLEIYEDLRFIFVDRENVQTVHSLPEFLRDINDDIGENNKKNIFSNSEKEPEQNVVLSAYQGDLKQQRAIEAQQDRLKKIAGTNPDKIKDEFYKSVQNKDLNATVAAVKLLALNSQLLDFIKSDQKLNKFLTATWLKLYGQEAADDFKKNPIQPKFVRLFLKYVLSDRLKMKESDAGRIALQIGNILVSQGKLEYNRMAYFDVSNKEFKWFED